jgi:methylmalonyl-CoA mutase N-terminal domain/subunit
VNAFTSEEEDEIPILKIDPEVERAQIARLKELKATRDNDLVQRRLQALSDAASRHENTMPYILEAVRAYATIGEIMSAMKAVFGTWREPVLV